MDNKLNNSSFNKSFEEIRAEIINHNSCAGGTPGFYSARELIDLLALREYNLRQDVWTVLNNLGEAKAKPKP
jgi:hypothetical protein